MNIVRDGNDYEPQQSPDPARLAAIRQRFERYSAGGWRDLPAADIAYLLDTLDALSVLQEQIAAAKAEVNSVCVEETLIGGIRNLRQALLSEQGNSEAAEAQVTALQAQLDEAHESIHRRAKGYNELSEERDALHAQLQEKEQQLVETRRLQVQSSEKHVSIAGKLTIANDRIADLEDALETANSKWEELQAILKETP